jgi:hypothetical protein
MPHYQLQDRTAIHPSNYSSELLPEAARNAHYPTVKLADAICFLETNVRESDASTVHRWKSCAARQRGESSPHSESGIVRSCLPQSGQSLTFRGAVQGDENSCNTSLTMSSMPLIFLYCITTEMRRGFPQSHRRTFRNL